MGCNSSKPVVQQTPATPSSPQKANGTATTKAAAIKKAGSVKGKALTGKPKVYNILSEASKRDDLKEFWSNIKELLDQDAQYATYTHPATQKTPLHLACSLIDKDDGTTDEMAKDCILPSIHALIRDCPSSVAAKDSEGFLPLHYVISPPAEGGRLKIRARVVTALVAADTKACQEYLTSNKILYESSGGVTPLFHVLETLPNDFAPSGITVEYVSAIQKVAPRTVVISNQSDGDKPLALLYRRFTRQFDLSEQFFTGDNSRPEVVDHRRKYKLAAGNTWKTIEVLLRPPPAEDHRWRVVHRAVQVECPPDLLRYIVETNAEEMTYADEAGNLPLHYAAKSIPTESSFPSFYSKYVVDELLYKFPEAAGIPDGNGHFPLTLAVSTGKQWIGGGVKSLYDAYPQALSQIDLDAHATLKKALSFEEGRENAVEPEEGEEALTSKGIVRDEHHDAIMMVQRTDVDSSEIVSAMWAHEEDAGVQMLGCVTIGRTLETATAADKLRIALATLAAVVNAMKAHPNEPVVQEKACGVLKQLACTDGAREVSFVASGAIAAIVGAMQAHVGDRNVQEEACSAIAGIVQFGGSGRATVVASVSGITALINAISAHPDSEGVQKAGCKALKYVSDFPDANVPELPQGQLQPVLEGTKEDFPSCTEDVDILLSRLS